MRIKLLTAMMACSLLVCAQHVTVTRHEQLLKGTESQTYNPVLSADGQKLLFSKENYQGLRMYDFMNDVTLKISDDQMAGWQPVFSGDHVYFLSQTRENMLTYREMKSYSLSGAKLETVAARTRQMKSPIPVGSGLAVKTEKGVQLRGAARSSASYVYGDVASMVIVRNGAEKRLAPVETEHMYMWCSLSPDQTKILFYAGGKGAYVADLDGNILADLGKYTAPVWFGNDYVVAQQSTDDGHQFESSKIVLLKADGSFKADLTRPESMSMNPTASGAANRIVYNTIDGRMFVMELEIK